MCSLASVLAAQHGRLSVWADAELDLCARHLQRVNQPLSEEAVELWITRRAEGKCPVSNACSSPKKGQVFCRVHAAFG